MKIKQIFLIISIFIGFSCYAQVFVPYDVTVFHNDKNLLNPFTGGFETPQFNQIDINNDDLKDIFVFDRKTSQIKIFRNDVVAFIYTQEYNDLFPEIKDWVLLRDFNNDGIMDIFTAPLVSSSSSIVVYKGIKRNSKLEYEKLTSPYGNEDFLSYLFFGNYLDVYVARTDIPVIQDIDNDGDLDILSFESGGGTVNFFKNLCMEEGLPLEDFKLELSDRCWGKFRESIFDEQIILSEDPNECAQEANFRHAGSTMSLIDLDGDLDLDIILGDSDYNGLKKIENGSKDQAFGIAVEDQFPEGDIPVDLDWFLGSYLFDLDNDDLSEMIVAPNTGSGSKNFDNVWLYRDTDPGINVNFSLIQEDFLIEDMIDWGSQIYPCFVDFDQDGLMDIVLGTSGLQEDRSSLTSRIIVYRNIGHSSSPIFTLWDDDYLNLANTGKTHLAPTFGDFNGDGAPDMVVGDADGTLLFYENSSPAGQAFAFDSGQEKFMSIDVGFNALPLIIDLNEDGINDLLIGNALSYVNDGKTGSLAGYLNVGTKNIPSFDPDLSSPKNMVPFQNIALHPNPFRLDAFVRPYLLHGEEKDHLIMGSTRGTITMFDWNNASVNNQSDTLFDLDLGEFCSPIGYDINNDGFIEVLIGTDAGGLKFYHTPIKSNLTKVNSTQNAPIFRVYPNPVSNCRIYIELDSAKAIIQPNELSIYDSNGKLQISQNLRTHFNQIDISNFNPGVYFVTFESVNQTHQKKLVVIENP